MKIARLPGIDFSGSRNNLRFQTWDSEGQTTFSVPDTFSVFPRCNALSLQDIVLNKVLLFLEQKGPLISSAKYIQAPRIRLPQLNCGASGGAEIDFGLLNFNNRPRFMIFLGRAGRLCDETVSGYSLSFEKGLEGTFINQLKECLASMIQTSSIDLTRRMNIRCAVDFNVRNRILAEAGLN